MGAGVVETAGKQLGTESKRQSSVPSLVAWSPGQDIDVRTWVKTGQRLGGMTRCSQWWLGDWVRYGNARWGEKYKEASRITGYDVQSLRNMAYVAGSIETYRRRDNLTWSHHAEVAPLDPEEQDRWLKLAETERMSVADLRIELRSARRVEGRSPSRARRAQLPSSKVTCPRCSHEFVPSE
jgi:hypothetical protein